MANCVCGHPLACHGTGLCWHCACQAAHDALIAAHPAMGSREGAKGQ